MVQTDRPQMRIWHVRIACWITKATNMVQADRPQMRIWHVRIACWITKATNMVQADRPQMRIWHVRIACWITKATNTHSEYVVFVAFPPKQWLHERASMLRYTYIVCLLI